MEKADYITALTQAPVDPFLSVGRDSLATHRKVKDIIARAGKDGIPRGALLARSGMKAEMLDAVTAALVASGLVAETTEVPAVGRPARVYREVGR